jgi:hypothetical protein
MVKLRDQMRTKPVTDADTVERMPHVMAATVAITTADMLSTRTPSHRDADWKLYIAWLLPSVSVCNREMKRSVSPKARTVSAPCSDSVTCATSGDRDIASRRCSSRLDRRKYRCDKQTETAATMPQNGEGEENYAPRHVETQHANHPKKHNARTRHDTTRDETNKRECAMQIERD